MFFNSEAQSVQCLSVCHVRSLSISVLFDVCLISLRKVARHLFPFNQLLH